MAFDTIYLDLSMRNPESGETYKACLYHLDGIQRNLTISELAMAICLQQATKYEAEIVANMAKTNTATNNLKTLTEIQTQVVNKDNLAEVAFKKGTLYWNGTYNADSFAGKDALIAYLRNTVKIEGLQDSASADDIISALSNKMDELNTINQKDLILLQNATGRRDAAYDLATALVKSFYTSNSGTASRL